MKTREEIYEEILGDMTKLYKTKNNDYGSSITDTYNKFGLVSFLVRIQDKLNRATTLNKQEAKVLDEKLEDTLIDMANYSVLALVEVLYQKQENLNE